MSTAHICPDPPQVGWGHVLTHRGGSSVRLRFQGLDGLSPASERPPGGRRQNITRFSPASRRRLMHSVAAINRTALRRMPVFVTLTYPRAWASDWQRWKRDLRTFLKRFTRRWGSHAVVWRLEFQKRGAPHFHLVFWDLKDHEMLREWVSHAWYEVVGSGDRRHLSAGTNVERVKEWRRVWAYLSKYVAKVEDGKIQRDRCSGRLWGIEDRGLLPVEPVSFLVSIGEALKLRRVLRRVVGRRMHRSRRMAGVSCYLGDDALRRYLAFASPDAWTWEGSGSDPPIELALSYLSPGI